MKMKYFVILLLSFVWLNPLKAQYDFDEKERVRMATAKVRTQTEWTHEYVNDRPSQKGHMSKVTKFNVKGLITEITNYDEKGEIISLIIYQYDNRDNRVNFERYQGNRKKLEYSQKTVFDARGNKVREYGFDGNTAYNNTFQYDAEGKLSEIVYNVDNAVVERRRFKTTGNKTEITVFDATNKLLFKQDNTYNSKGLLVSEVRTGGAGAVMHTLNMQYNNIGDLTEEVRKRADDKLDYQKIYQYDNQNRPVKEETVNLDGSRFVSREYQFNNVGDLMLESWRKTERAREPSTKKFTYDAKGLYTEIESYFATYQLKSLYKYVYEFY